MIFSFELPVTSHSLQSATANASPFSSSPFVRKIEEELNVQVIFRTRPKLHATLVQVKGCEWEVDNVKHATVVLMHFMCQSHAVRIQTILLYSMKLILSVLIFKIQSCY